MNFFLKIETNLQDALLKIEESNVIELFGIKVDTVADNVIQHKVNLVLPKLEKNTFVSKESEKAAYHEYLNSGLEWKKYKKGKNPEDLINVQRVALSIYYENKCKGYQTPPKHVMQVVTNDDGLSHVQFNCRGQVERT